MQLVTESPESINFARVTRVRESTEFATAPVVRREIQRCRFACFEAILLIPFTSRPISFRWRWSVGTRCAKRRTRSRRMSSKLFRSGLFGLVISRVKFCMISALEKRNPGGECNA